MPPAQQAVCREHESRSAEDFSRRQPMKNDLLPLLRIDGESSATLGHQEHVIGRTPLVCDDRVGGEMAQSGCRQNHLVIKRRKSSRNLDLESAARVAGFERGIREWFQESWLPISALQDHDSIRSIGITSKEAKRETSSSDRQADSRNHVLCLVARWQVLGNEDVTC